MTYQTNPFQAQRPGRAPLIISCVTAGVVVLAGVVVATLYFSRAAAPTPAPQVPQAASTTTPTTPSPQTQYLVPAPAPLYVAPPPTPYVAPYTKYVSPPSYSYGSDADFISRMRARDIVTPGESAEIAGAHGVCSGMESGSTIHDEANALMESPYDYSATLAGYFAGEAVKVYCPQFAGQLSG